MAGQQIDTTRLDPERYPPDRFHTDYWGKHYVFVESKWRSEKFRPMHSPMTDLMEEVLDSVANKSRTLPEITRWAKRIGKALQEDKFQWLINKLEGPPSDPDEYPKPNGATTVCVGHLRSHGLIESRLVAYQHDTDMPLEEFEKKLHELRDSEDPPFTLLEQILAPFEPISGEENLLRRRIRLGLGEGVGFLHVFRMNKDANDGGRRNRRKPREELQDAKLPAWKPAFVHIE